MPQHLPVHSSPVVVGGLRPRPAHFHMPVLALLVGGSALLELEVEFVVFLPDQLAETSNLLQFRFEVDDSLLELLVMNSLLLGDP